MNDGRIDRDRQIGERKNGRGVGHVVQFVADVRDRFVPREDCGIVGAQVALDADE
jgi:hypothetical protein